VKALRNELDDATGPVLGCQNNTEVTFGEQALKVRPGVGVAKDVALRHINQFVS
jgi:hypothetical protein